MASTRDDSYWSEVSTILDNHSMKKYYISYEGFKFNHMSHGVYALYRLGAPVDQIKLFVESKAPRLESAYENKERELKEEPRPEEISDLIGQKQSFYHIYNYFEELLDSKYGGSTEEMIAKEFPKLSQRIASSGVHGPIHLGYAIAAGKPWMVCEALAYLLYSNIPLTPSTTLSGLETLGHGTMNIVNVIQKIRNDTQLIAFMNNSYMSYSSRTPLSTYGRKTGVLSANKADEIFEYVNLIEFPEEIKANKLILDKVPKVTRWLTDCAITVYAIAQEPNNFFLLHGVTMAWSLKNVLPLLTTIEDVLDVVRSFLGGLLVVYLSQGYPDLQLELLTQSDGMSYNWKDMVHAAIDNEDYEEHIYKLVQVCQDMSIEYPNSNMETLYRLAAHHCVSEPLTFTPV